MKDRKRSDTTRYFKNHRYCLYSLQSYTFQVLYDQTPSTELKVTRLLITGNFNVHVDIPDDPDTIKLLDLLESFPLRQ